MSRKPLAPSVALCYFLLGCGMLLLRGGNKSMRVLEEASFETTVEDDAPDSNATASAAVTAAAADAANWWEPYVETSSRAFRPWKDSHSWCKLPDKFANATDAAANGGEEDDLTSDPGGTLMQGIIYVKSHKASSSTCGGIARSIAHKVGRRALPEKVPCTHYAHHLTGNQKRHAKRNVTNSILWSFVREPTSRDWSHVNFFGVLRNGMEGTDENLLAQLRAQKGKQIKYLSTTNKLKQKMANRTMRQTEEDTIRIAEEEVLHNYDFIGVTERMSESLAVMTLLWDLDATDVIVLSAKRAGGYDTGGFRGGCLKIKKVDKTPAIRQYLETEHLQNNLDYFLYRAVNRSLDKTIQTLGPHRVRGRVRQIEALQKMANERCVSQAVYPCSEDGVPQFDASRENCYESDHGCGYQCVDRALKAYARYRD